MQFGEQAIEKIFMQETTGLFMLTEDTGSDFFKNFENVARKFKEEYVFVYSDLQGEEGQQLADFFGIKQDSLQDVLPVIRIVNPTDQQRYAFEGDVKAATEADIEKFVSDFKAGNLTPFYLSEDIPEVATVDGLTTVVGKSFDKIVMDRKNDVFVFYYAPWCDHCASMKSTWSDLAKETEGFEDLVIASMDATVNEHASLQVEDFPTLILYTKDDKTGKYIYEKEDRDMDNFKSFLTKNSGAYRKATGDQHPLTEDL